MLGDVLQQMITISCSLFKLNRYMGFTIFTAHTVLFIWITKACHAQILFLFGSQLYVTHKTSVDPLFTTNSRFFAHLENALHAIPTLYNRASPSPIEHFLSVRLLYSAFNNYKTNRNMNNSPRRKTLRDLKNLKVIPKKHYI